MASEGISGAYRGDASRMFQDYIVASLPAPVEIGSLSAWESRRDSLQGPLEKVFGVRDYLDGKIPLDIEYGETIDLPGYSIVKVSYSIGLGIRIPGLLHLPKDGKDRHPAVVYAEGNQWVEKKHFGNNQWQAFAQRMALKGYVVLGLGSIGCYGNTDVNGEVPWMWALDMAGGYFPYLKGVYPYLQAFRLLASRDDVDTSRIGITGVSWGGTAAYHAAFFQPGYKVVVSVCAQPTTFEARIRGGILGSANGMGSEYQVHGFDDAVVYRLLAPRPALFISSAGDLPPDPRTSMDPVLERGRDVYRLYGAGNNLASHVDSGLHDYGRSKRERAYAWFDHYLMQDTASDPAGTTPEVIDALLPPWRLELPAYGGSSIRDLAYEITEARRFSIPTTRGAAATSAALRTHRADLQRELGIDVSGEAGVVRLVARNGDDSVAVAYYQVETRPGFHLPLVEMARTHGANGKTVLILSDGDGGRRDLASSAERPRRAALFDRLLDRGYRILALDLVGTGELAQHVHNPGWDAVNPFYSSAFFANAETLYRGKNHIGSAVSDVGKVLRALAPDTGSRRGAALVCMGGYASFVGGLAAAYMQEAKLLVVDDYLDDLSDLPLHPDLRGDYLLYRQGIHGLTDMPYLLGLAAPKPTFLGIARGAEALVNPSDRTEIASAWTIQAFAGLGVGREIGWFDADRWDPAVFADSTLGWMEGHDLFNDPPKMREDVPQPLLAFPTQPFIYRLSVVDPEGLPIAIEVKGLPSWLRYDSLTLMGTPGWNHLGRFTVTVKATAGNSTASIPLSIEVVPSRDTSGLRFTTQPLSEVVAGGIYRYSPSVEDEVCPDCPSDFHFSVPSGPSWLEVDSSTGQLQGTPSLEDSGRHTVILVAKSSNRRVAMQSFSLTVLVPEKGTEYLPFPEETIYSGLVYRRNLLGPGVAPGSGARFSIVSGPAWIEIDTLGNLQGIPPAGLAGSDTVRLEIGGREFWSLPLLVVDPSGLLHPTSPVDSLGLHLGIPGILFTWNGPPIADGSYSLRIWGETGDSLVSNVADTSRYLPWSSLAGLLDSTGRLRWSVGFNSVMGHFSSRDTFVAYIRPRLATRIAESVELRVLRNGFGSGKSLLVQNQSEMELTLRRVDPLGRRMAPTVRFRLAPGRHRIPLDEDRRTRNGFLVVTGRSLVGTGPFFYFKKIVRLVD